MKQPTWSWQTVVMVGILAGVGGGLCFAKMPEVGVPVLMAAVALACLAMTLSLLFFGCVDGCKPMEAPDPNAAIYGIELQSCAETAKTWPEYDLCKDSVKARWGRLDGGTGG